jgi:hypothetical protein
MNRWTAILLLAVAAPSVAAQQNPAGFSGMPLMEHARPGAGAGPTDVRIALFVIDIKRLEDVEQTAAVDFILFYEWADPGLALADPPAEGTGLRSFTMDEIWHPFMQIANIDRLWPQLPQRIRVDRSGRCAYMQRYVGTLSFPVALRDFPFDEQKVQFVVVSAAHSPEEVQLIVDDGFCGGGKFTVVDWLIGPGSFAAEPIAMRSGKPPLAAFRASFAAHRYGHYYVLKIITPLVFIIVMSFAAFWIAPTQFGPRVSVGVTAVLTLIAYRFLLGSLVPRVSYMTRLDIFILGATIIVFLALIETLAVHRYVALDRGGRSPVLDRVARVVGPAGLVGMLLVFVL